MSLRNEEDFDNFDDYLFHMAGGDVEQASGGDVSSNSEAASSQSAAVRSPPEERDSDSEMDVSSSSHPPSPPSFGSSVEEMDTGAFGPSNLSSSEEDSEGMSDAPSDHESTGALDNEEVQMVDVESSPEEVQIARDIPLPSPSLVNPPAEVGEIHMRDADPAPASEPHQEKSVEPVSQGEEEKEHTTTTTTQEEKEEEEEEVTEMQASPQPSPPPPPAAPITRDTPASPPSASVQEPQLPAPEPESIQEVRAPALVANEAIPPPTPSPPPFAKSARIQTLLPSLALLNETSVAFFSRLDILHAKIEAL
ncbi:hypothetical protein J3E72DRAFT_267591 [Bipolaris maydis]|nr:hypothetical protein J3E72DRAFT_267591 [Bipolaris maydis]